MKGDRTMAAAIILIAAVAAGITAIEKREQKTMQEVTAAYDAYYERLNQMMGLTR